MKILQILLIGIFCLFVFAPPIFAVTPPCASGDTRVECVFGTISPPPAIQQFIGTDTTGTGGISKFLSNLITLFYSLALVVLIFMILWGAFDWMTSEGDKEKVAAAQRKLLNAFIGILLFAIAFAVVRLVGQFTGFTFFAGQNIQVVTDTKGNIIVTCPNGGTFLHLVGAVFGKESSLAYRFLSFV